MNSGHRNGLILQIGIMTALCIMSFFKIENLIGLIGFFVAEIITLESQRRENPEMVRYQKGCFFAFADLFSVIYFLAVFGLVIWSNFQSGTIPGVRFHKWLYLYIAVRKFYILRNYSYFK